MIKASILEIAIGIMFSTIFLLAIAEVWKRLFPRDTAQDDLIVSNVLEGSVANFCARVRNEHNVNMQVEDFKNQFSKEEFEEFALQLFKADAKQMKALVKDIADANRDEFGPVNG